MLAVGRAEITCAPIEYVTVNPPSGQTCQQYLSQYINGFGGYLTNPDAVDNCQFCGFRTTDEYLQVNSNIFFSHHWRNLGLMFVYIAFNVRHFVLNVRGINSCVSLLLAQVFAVFAITYVFRIRGPANLFSRKK